MEQLEFVYKSFVAIGGAIVSYVWGGWSNLFGILLAVITIDYCCGVLAAAIEGELDSEIGLKGIAKKIAILFLVAVGHLIDVVVGDGDIVRDAVILFYLVNELLSILENTGRMGLPVPAFLKKAVKILKEKGKTDVSQ